MEIKTIGLASDHAAFSLKQFVKKYLEEKGITYKDYGTRTEESCNYATYGHALAEGIEQEEVEMGIAMCGSGEGISMTLNKHQGIRAGLVWRPDIAHLIREHNNANVIVFPGRFMDEETCRQCLDEFLSTDFAGGRHLQRIADIPVK
ncbi:MAG: RpiB/LacA/LacB family sugar-phosphate isomerase [Bacteroidales bacterium]|nr:RpiB/LacA/LacB family sugar-phosphate isomerase [Candidatus Physcousia equi]